MEDYIFIIIAIILSAIGAASRKKKQRIAQMEDDDSTYQKQPSIFDQFLDDPLFNDEPEFAPQVVPEQKPVVKKKVEPLRKEPLLKKTQERQVKKQTLIEEDPESETTLDSIRKDFSLKKAVIYSEILNPKY